MIDSGPDFDMARQLIERSGRMDRMMSRMGIAALALAVAAVPLAAFAAGDEPAAPALSEAQLTKARQMFVDNGCVACHTLADANAAGTVGPSFDGDANLD